MKVYGLSTCDTCRKVRKALPEAEFIDVRSDGLPPDVLNSAFEIFGDKLLNTKSKTWRELAEEQRKGKAVELIAAHPLLMKRPLIERAGQYYLGWTQNVQDAVVL